MNKLKTVKDLKEEYLKSEKELKTKFPNVKEMTDGALILLDRVEKEAIKDYKYYAKKVSQRKPIDNVLDYIKQKNNLTDGDLK